MSLTARSFGIMIQGPADPLLGSQQGQLYSLKFSAYGNRNLPLLDAISGASLEVLGVFFSLTGTAPTVVFQDSDGTALTGTYDAAGIYRSRARRLVPKFSTPNGKGLKAVVVGGDASFQGFLVYRLNTVS